MAEFHTDRLNIRFNNYLVTQNIDSPTISLANVTENGAISFRNKSKLGKLLEYITRYIRIVSLLRRFNMAIISFDRFNEVPLKIETGWQHNSAGITKDYVV